MVHETELNLNFGIFVNFRENKDNTHCLFLLCFVREHVQSPVQCFFLQSRYHEKVVSQRSQKKFTNLVDFCFKCLSRIKESNNFTKIRRGFFLVYLPNFLVGHLYILLNKKCSQETGECVFPNSRYYFLPNSYKRETRFFDPFCARFSETLAICSICCVREAVCSC